MVSSKFWAQPPMYYHGQTNDLKIELLRFKENFSQ